MASDKTARNRPAAAGKAPAGVDPASRAAYEAGLRDRAKLQGRDLDPERAAVMGPSEGAGGGGNIAGLPGDQKERG